MEKSTASTIVTSSSLFLIFVTFNAVLEATSNETVNDEIRNLLALTSIIISSITLVPFILQWIHPKFGFIIGALCMLLFVAISQTDIEPLLYIASLVVGIGYSLVMVSWQQIVARCVNLHELKHGLPFNSTIGRFDCIAVCALCLSRSFGKILSLLPNDDHIPTEMTVLILCFISLSSIAIMVINLDEKFVRSLAFSERTLSDCTPSTTPLLTTPYDPVHDDSTFSFITPISFKSPSHYNTFQLHRNLHQFAVPPIDDEMETDVGFGSLEQDICGNRGGEGQRSRYRWCWNAMRLWNERRLQCIILMTIYWGFWLQFMWSEFPSSIPLKSDQFQIAIMIGIVDGILSFVVGQISDYLHRLKLIGVGILVQILVFSVHFGLLLKNERSNEENLWYFYVMAMLIATADALLSTTMYILYPLFMGQRTDTFANGVFWQTIGFTFANIVHLVGIEDIASKLIMYYLSVFLCCLPLFLSRYAMKLGQSKFNIVIQKRLSSGAFN